MESKEQGKKEIAMEAMKVINELEESVRLEDVIKDNKIPFVVNEVSFRVRRPSVQEQEEINNKRRVKYLELVEDDSYRFRKQWLKTYLQKGVDILEMESSIVKLNDVVKTLLLRLAQETSTGNISKIRTEIMKTRAKQSDINIEKVDLMINSIEDQLVLYTNSYTSFLVLEKQNGGHWERHFNTYEEYQACDDWNLLNQMYYWMNVLMYEAEM